MELINEHLDELVNLIIRPPRRTYKEWELGNIIFTLEDGNMYKRVDFQVKNKRNQVLHCSQYYRLRHRKKMAVVIYCHGNSGCRLDAQEAINHLLKMEISVVCFDFSGSGNSDGEWVSLGHFEQDDLAAVVEHLRKNEQTTRIGLWGRSMGAATSLMFGVSDPSVACMVLDSSFSSLKVLANELVSKNELKIPKMVVAMAFKMLKKTIEKKAAFDIEKLEPIKSAPKCFIPALFAHANDDDFIDQSHSKALSGKYAGDFNLINFEGDHTSTRPSFFYDSVCIFFNNNLLMTPDFGDDNPYIEEELTVDEVKDMGDFSSTNTRNRKKIGGGGGGGVIVENEFERARQLSLQAYTPAPFSTEEEEEQLALALKLSLLENETDTKKTESTTTTDTAKIESTNNTTISTTSTSTAKTEQEKSVTTGTGGGGKKKDSKSSTKQSKKQNPDEERVSLEAEDDNNSNNNNNNNNEDKDKKKSKKSSATTTTNNNNNKKKK